MVKSNKSDIWSASKLGYLFGCRRAFQYRYIDHEKAPTNIKPAFGTAFALYYGRN